MFDDFLHRLVSGSLPLKQHRIRQTLTNAATTRSGMQRRIQLNTVALLSAKSKCITVVERSQSKTTGIKYIAVMFDDCWRFGLVVTR